MGASEACCTAGLLFRDCKWRSGSNGDCCGISPAPLGPSCGYARWTNQPTPPEQCGCDESFVLRGAIRKIIARAEKAAAWQWSVEMLLGEIRTIAAPILEWKAPKPPR